MNFLNASLSRYTAAVFLFLFVNITTAAAQQAFNISSQDMDAEIVPRLSHDEAEAAITTQDGYVDLLLAGEFLIIQFSDKKLDRISGEIHGDKADADEAHFVAVLKSMLSSGVRTLLDRGLGIPLYEISEISYDNGRLMILNMDGDEIFKEAEIDNQLLMEQFPERDARRFIEEVERRMI